jgi:hypothetical protein
VALVLLLLGLVISAVFVLPERLVSSQVKLTHEDRPKLVNDVRTTLLQAVGGVLLVLGAITAFRQLQVTRPLLVLSGRLRPHR